ncbi:polysaccharide deacetylase family protein [Gaoshiqia sediminis]|uniref:Polysaccharide deacetylase family protein n=1 Tax=Gaoshiqia sediminis TaxID=2986998 RepID=A0AA41Y1D0_9BACT|nr:polysaccharide deacetylase family protein [Gaoshiqia sediminis]MCW0481664.1 polysaccharide deacetylase family protein [Gaoshiqia sediminis]
MDFIKAKRDRSWEMIPDYALAITFDDGWKENYELLPVFQKYNLRPTLFLTSQVINTERHFWWTACCNGDVERLKRIPNMQRLAELEKKYRYDQDKEYKGDRQALNVNEIEKMKDFVDFGLHTRYHPVLTQCTMEEKRDEIMAGKLELEEILGRRIEAFAYPNGDYDEECIHMLRECGLKIARTTDAGWNDINSNSYKLKVTGASDNGSITKLVAELTGIPRFFQYAGYHGNFNGLKNKPKL